jgi:hypothetical protein
MAFWKKNEPADPDDGVQVTPLPGGGRQETFFDADGNIIATEGD